MKLDGATGAVLWHKAFQGGVTDTGAINVVSASDGGFVVSEPVGGGDVWLAKIASNGTASWMERFGGAGQENASLPRVQQTTDRGFILGCAGDPAGAVRRRPEGNPELAG